MQTKIEHFYKLTKDKNLKGLLRGLTIINSYYFDLKNQKICYFEMFNFKIKINFKHC